MKAEPASSLILDVFAAAQAEFARRAAALDSGADPDAIHELRIACRKVRALIRCYRKAVSRSVSRLDRDVRDFGRVLGAVRDSDVFLEWLRQEAQSQPALAPIAAAVEAERDRRRAQLFETLRSGCVDRILGEFPTAAWLEDSEGGKSLRDLWAAAADSLQARIGRLHRGSSDLKFHGLRKALKRIRYGLMPISTEAQDGQAHVLPTLEKAQKAFGRFQDSVVRCAELSRIRSTASLPLSTRAAMDLALRTESARLSDRREHAYQVAQELRTELRRMS